MRFTTKLYCLAVLLMLLGCKQEFLELEPQSQATSASFYENEEDMELALIAAYDGLSSNGQYGRNFVYFMEIRSDNSQMTSNTSSGGIYGDFELFRIDPTNPVLEETWISCYETIQRANIFLNRVDAIAFPHADKNVRKGEARFIRALVYFNLVRLWGEVPLVLSEIENPFDAFDHTRSSVSEVYEAIAQDLEAAISALPTKSGQDEGRVTKGAAQALLAKVYLTLKEYDNAWVLLEEVINSGDYSLYSDFGDNFQVANENGIESIFEIQYMKGNSGEGSGYVNQFAPLGDQTLTGGVGAARGENLPTPEFTTIYDTADLRKAWTIDTLDNGSWYTSKYQDTPFEDSDADNNFIVLRYADVLLMAAEIRNEQGYEADGVAFQYLNEVRSRAGLSTYTTAELDSPEAFRTAVLLERRLELAFENHRWFDLIRTETAIETMANSDPAVSVASHQFLFPVPQGQIDASPNNIYQNEGY